jgi:hypothetical protein
MMKAAQIRCVKAQANKHISRGYEQTMSDTVMLRHLDVAIVTMDRNRL